jgi:hypothetical protein
VSTATGTYTTAMFPRAAAVCVAIGIAAVGTIGLGAQDLPSAPLDRAIAVANRRYQEWLGPAQVAPPSLNNPPLAGLFLSAPMELESQVAFRLARARFSAIPDATDTRAFVDGVSWHLQARVVEELFDYAQHQPGHHADSVLLFGGHLRWGIPTLVLPLRARDDRAPANVQHAADAVATLESVVGWPALAASLRVLANAEAPLRDRDQIRALLETGLGIPLDWFFAALDPGFRINYSLASVNSREADCGQSRCYRTEIEVVRDGQVLFPEPARPFGEQIPIRVDFGGGAQPATLWWSGADARRTFTIETGLAPAAVSLDPAFAVRLDSNRLDQRWRAEPAQHPAPIKSFASWVIWLQNAALTYGVLL